MTESDNVAKWGVEVEAGWIPECGWNGYEDCPRVQRGVFCRHDLINQIGLSNPWTIQHDGSIHLSERSRRMEMPSVPHELTSPPMESKELLKADMKILWKQINQVNDTMGFHIHASMKKRRTYYLLSSWDYIKYFQDIAIAHHDLAERLGNRFCKMYMSKLEFTKDYDRQIVLKDKHEWRYRPINFAWARYGTLEYRLFPMHRSVTKMLTYIDLVDDSISDFLSRQSSSGGGGAVPDESVLSLSNEDMEDSVILKPIELKPTLPSREFIIRKVLGEKEVRMPDSEGFLYNIGMNVVVNSTFWSSQYCESKSNLMLVAGKTFKITQRHKYVESHSNMNGRNYYVLEIPSITRKYIYIDEMDLRYDGISGPRHVVTNSSVVIGDLVKVTLESLQFSSSLTDTDRMYRMSLPTNNLGIVREISNNRNGRIQISCDFNLPDSINLDARSLEVVNDFQGHSILYPGDVFRVNTFLNSEAIGFPPSIELQHILRLNPDIEFRAQGLYWWAYGGGSSLYVYVNTSSGQRYKIALLDTQFIRRDSQIDRQAPSGENPRFSTIPNSQICVICQSSLDDDNDAIVCENRDCMNAYCGSHISGNIFNCDVCDSSFCSLHWNIHEHNVYDSGNDDDDDRVSNDNDWPSIRPNWPGLPEPETESPAQGIEVSNRNTISTTNTTATTATTGTDATYWIDALGRRRQRREL